MTDDYVDKCLYVSLHKVFFGSGVKRESWQRSCLQCNSGGRKLNMHILVVTFSGESLDLVQFRNLIMMKIVSHYLQQCRT